MKDDYVKDLMVKYHEQYNEPDEFEKGSLFAVTQILAMLENYKTKIVIDGGKDFYYIDPSVITQIKEEFSI
jgi:hypothetical protein